MTQLSETSKLLVKRRLRSKRSAGRHPPVPAMVGPMNTHPAQGCREQCSSSPLDTQLPHRAARRGQVRVTAAGRRRLDCRGKGGLRTSAGGWPNRPSAALRIAPWTWISRAHDVLGRARIRGESDRRPARRCLATIAGDRAEGASFCHCGLRRSSGSLGSGGGNAGVDHDKLLRDGPSPVGVVIPHCACRKFQLPWKCHC